MKIREVVSDKSLAGKRLERDLLDFVIGLRASNIDQYSTEDFVDQINQLGHALSTEALISLWANDENKPEIVKNITANTITLGTPSVDNDQTTNNNDDQSLKLGRKARRNIQSR